MDAIDVFWHVCSFFAPALGVGAIASLLAKVLWHGDLRRVSWRRLFGAATAVSAAVLVAGLVFFGRDGKMATYAAMVLGCALALWPIGFDRRH